MAWPDGQAVCLAYARTAIPETQPGGWLVQSKLPADWVRRSATGLFVVRAAAAPSPTDSRFDFLTHAIDVDAYVPADGGRTMALSVVHAFKAALVAGALVSGKGRTNGPPDIVTAPFQFPDENVPEGVARITAAFRATFAL